MTHLFEPIPAATESLFPRSESEERWPDHDARGENPFGSGDELRHFIAVLVDANHRLHDADRRKDEFMAMMGHEMRNPLAAVASALEIIRRKQQLQPDPAIIWACEVLTRQFAQLTRLVADFLDIARIARGGIQLSCEDISLNAVIERAVESSGPLLNQRHQQLIVEMPETPLQVVGDAGRLVQVFDNLLTNAAKYMHEGGRVCLVLHRAGEQAVCTVTDEGLGIASEKLETIFETFTQLHSPGSAGVGGMGMGLAIVRRLLTLHHGSVHASSRGLGRGSSFEVRLPLLSAG